MTRPRLETAPGCFTDCGDSRQRILDQIGDPAAKKLLIVRWGMRGEIAPAEAEALIRDNGLEAA